MSLESGSAARFVLTTKRLAPPQIDEAADTPPTLEIINHNTLVSITGPTASTLEVGTTSTYFTELNITSAWVPAIRAIWRWNKTPLTFEMRIDSPVGDNV